MSTYLVAISQMPGILFIQNMKNSELVLGDCLTVLKTLPSESIHCCVTSPPYWGLRDYGVQGQLGLEKTPGEYVEKMLAVFREVKRVLRPDGTLWLNLGDSYAGGGNNRGGNLGNLSTKQKSNRGATGQCDAHSRHIHTVPGIKNKDLVGIPWTVAFALRADGWFLRQDIIWHKPNPMPESIKDRCTKAHEYIFLFSKSSRYHFDHKAIMETSKYPEGPRNKKPHAKTNVDGSIALRTRKNLSTIGMRLTRHKRSVWTVTTKPFRGAHFATFPPDLIEPCILAGCPPGGTVLDPFFGAGTTGVVALKHGRKVLGIELNPDYLNLAQGRLDLF